MVDLSGKVALVTGAAGMRGMGRAIALRLAKDGADVVVTDHPKVSLTPESRQSGWKGVESVAEEINALGRQGLAVSADITSSSDVDEIVSQTLGKFGKIDILVNNAGIPGPPRTQTVNMDLKDWELVMRVNVNGPFMLSKLVAKGMIQRGKGGKILMTASESGKMGINGLSAYCASKAALISLTQTLALELAQYKINVNAICPGRFPTDIDYPVIERIAKERGMTVQQARDLMPKEFQPTDIPLGRWGEVQDIANAMAFLASPEADYITGQAINVCGGFLMVR
ncbi:MAG: SDR family NAD(P)-dependent oxidoreductase [Dehalococcoidales bacterium]|nr:SDR family NAD(P)-dependent oxidoreductase [Dehalococcoidales bacterium]